MVDPTFDEIAALLRTIGYTVCATTYLYRTCDNTRWRWVNLATALQYTASIAIGVVVIIKPDAIAAFRLYILTPLMAAVTITCLIQLTRELRH